VNPSVVARLVELAERALRLANDYEGDPLTDDLRDLADVVVPLAEDWARLREALEEIAASHGVGCSYAHGVECRGNNKLREKARAALDLKEEPPA
jgi:hypothetical protein